MSLPAQHRLRHRREFSKVYKHGLRYSSEHLAIRAYKSKKAPQQRGSRVYCGEPKRRHRTRRNEKAVAIAPADGDRHRSREPAYMHGLGKGNRHENAHLPKINQPKINQREPHQPEALQDNSKQKASEQGDCDYSMDSMGQGECPTRVGISISQKVSKKAVVRNRLKRQIKAAIRYLLPQIQSGWLLVIIVRPSAIQCDYWQFLRELEQMLKKIEVIDGHS